MRNETNFGLLIVFLFLLLVSPLIGLVFAGILLTIVTINYAGKSKEYNEEKGTEPRTFTKSFNPDDYAFDDDDEPTIMDDTTTPFKIKPVVSKQPFLGNMYMSAKDKAKHLRSPYWAKLKSRRLIIAKNSCEKCSRTDYLVLHHETYANLGAEGITDVRIICQPCHQDIHDRLGYDRFVYFPICENIV